MLHKHRLNKKGMELWILMSLILVVVILIIVVGLVIRNFKLLEANGKCVSTGGTCIPMTEDCDGQKTPSTCENKAEVCCFKV